MATSDQDRSWRPDRASRREVLARLALGLGVLACGGAPARASGKPVDSGAEGAVRTAVERAAGRAVYAGIETSADSGLSRACFFTGSGAPSGTVALDFRAHGMAAHGDRLVVFPRRPGNRFAMVDLRTLDVLHVETAPANRHFYGHGAFTLDGAHLLVTENDLETLQGGVGVYDTSGPLRRLGRIELPGPGPHEIVRDPGRDRFHVALGGLETHPAYGRTPLNLPGFRSQVVSLAFERGSVEALGFWPGTEGVSLRHLAVSAGDRLIVGGHLVDSERGTSERVLWACDARGAVPLDAGRRLGGYVSSVAAHGEDTVVTSKEAGLALWIGADRSVRTSSLVGASGAALAPGLDAVSGFETLVVNGVRISASPLHEFDNHGLATPRA